MGIFEARDKDFSDQWRTITGQVGCSLCRTVLPPNAEYGKGKHALVDYAARGVKVICDQCYVNLVESRGQVDRDPDELSRRAYIEREIRKARAELYQNTSYDYHRNRPPTARQTRLGKKQIDYQPFIREAKRLGKALWEDLTGNNNGRREDYN